jgi:DNA-binding cell septation regulator SpoVG
MFFTSIERGCRMKVEIVRIKVFEGESKKKAAVDIKIGGMITIYGCSIAEGKEGSLFLGLPQRKDMKQENKWWSIVKIDDQGLYKLVTDKAVEAYFQAMKPVKEQNPVNPDEIAWDE